MALRFRKTITLAPGLRLNLGKRGASLSAGPRGASVTFGRNGLFGNVGLPGTGLSYRTRLDGGGGARRRSRAAEPYVPITARVTESGELVLSDPDGNALSDAARAAALQRNGPALVALLEQRAADLNGWFERVLRPHLETPPPERAHQGFVPERYSLPKPEKPEPEDVGFIEAWFGGRDRAEARYQAELAGYRAAIAGWRAEEENHRLAQETARRRHELWLSGDEEETRARFGEQLRAISWPRETLVAYEASGSTLSADIDLPEIEDMPRQTARVLRREMRVDLKSKGETEARRDYADHVHSIAFRVAGEAFAAMPALRMATISGYSQRLSRATARVEDEYLYSVQIDRVGWERIDFNRLPEVDPIEALDRFDLRREMTRLFNFRRITPHL